MSTGPILLVEDDPDIQQNLRLFLELEGFEVRSAYNGQEALDYLGSGEPAGVILLDLMMPVMDGLEFLEKFRSKQSKAFGDVPVIVLSAAPGLERVARASGLRFIKKPINLELLLEAIGPRRE